MILSYSTAAILIRSAAPFVFAAPASLHAMTKHDEKEPIQTSSQSYVEQPSIIIDSDIYQPSSTLKSSLTLIASKSINIPALNSPVIMTFETFIPIIVKPDKTVPIVKASSSGVLSFTPTSTSASVDTDFPSFHFGHGPAIVPSLGSTIVTTTTTQLLTATHLTGFASQTKSIPMSTTSVLSIAPTFRTSYPAHIVLDST